MRAAADLQDDVQISWDEVAFEECATLVVAEDARVTREIPVALLQALLAAEQAAHAVDVLIRRVVGP